MRKRSMAFAATTMPSSASMPARPVRNPDRSELGLAESQKEDSLTMALAEEMDGMQDDAIVSLTFFGAHPHEDDR